ncbi:hypothetical protein FD754_013202 [Muntiacus muntjak]|uniref:Helicase ATP-binding domain-containing protein n=1 Tax=Muntiacus muntjak TaxID=9888 RepID=A0A5N3VJ49_MUNMU|nr:hypothetical protein FD754_013202 [Muntiacus muntjak]
MALPRLTGALRSFSNVTKQDNYNEEVADLQVHFGTDNGKEAIESAAAFLFKTFHLKDCVGHQETKAIKQMFGPFPSSSATAACDATNRITSYFSKDSLTALVQMTSDEYGDRVLFGKNLAFSFDMHDLDHFDELPINGESQKTISLDYKKFLTDHLQEHSTLNRKPSEKTNDSFLWCEVEKYLNATLNEMAEATRIEDLCCTLYDMLASVKSGDELQDEVQEQALMNARNVPILSRQRDTDVEKIRYPHVYDSQAEAMRTSAFIAGAKMLVTTPEKWDVVTRKSVGDVALSQIVKLLILDEVHLLHEDRGPVLESIVARTLRQVESTQSMIRILGLSATLPNYLDVATFLHVNPCIGLFFFDGRFRPVPLGQTFLGVKSANKGTQIYAAKRGSFVDLGILDVMQIFGRAGRPQFDKFGEGIIITTHDKLSHYLSLLTQQNPIESQFLESLADNLNAEIALGTVTNVEEAVKWISYTYLYVRMRANPLVYGISHKAYQIDPTLAKHREQLVIEVGRKLDKARMIRFEERTGYFSSTDLGRTASHYYIKYNTIETFNELFDAHKTESDIFAIVSKAEEFDQIKVREEEIEELDTLLSNFCELSAPGGVENSYGKINILLQTYISRGEVDSFSLISDSAYVAQNAARIVRALFEIALRKRWPAMTYRLLNLSKVIDKRLWGWTSPLRQFSVLPPHILTRLEEKNLTVDKLKDMRKDEIGHILHHVNIGLKVKQCVHQIPSVTMEASIQPITRTVLRVTLSISPDFSWNDQVHGTVGEPWWIWVEDPTNDHIYHSEYFLVLKKQVISKEAQLLVFTIPIFEPLPSQYYIRAVSDRWLGAEAVCIINFQHLILPERHPPHTELLDLQPLPITALGCEAYEALYNFSHFNPVQTQIFHTLYHTDCNVLLGAPTGSGKTVAAELAIFRVFNKYPTSKAVYIAPLKALVRERMDDWKVRIEEKLGKKVIELTGDVTPDMKSIAKADLIVTTPEKWDGISRSWQNRNYVKQVTILIIDEIHLLGEERGPVLEVIVSRTNFISSHTEKPVRIVGLSTALANARDLADWLNIRQMGLFNFRPSVRPVPLEVHIQGFPGQHYCPRMASMNKPTFQAIRSHSPAKPVLIFVSSRRQTRLTALELIAFLATEEDPKQWLNMDEREVLIATSTLAWGVNFPAHLVIIKGTEYYDGKTRRYVDFPITDVLQMMGRAGRPQFDDQGKAVILVHDIKKDFYKKFLYEPFPDAEEYTDLPVRHNEDHMNSELAKCLPLESNPHSFDSPHTKAHLLLQAHLSRAMLPCPDYDTDTKTVLDQALRVCQNYLVLMLFLRKWSPGMKGPRAGYHGSVECLPELIHVCAGKDHVFSSMIEKELPAPKMKQAWNFLSHLPVIDVGLSVKGWWDDAAEGHDEVSITTLASDKRSDNRWVRLHADQEYVLQVSLQRVSLGFHKGKQDSHAVTPRFPKSKDEGWFLILGEVDKRELIALKRVGYVRSHHVVSISFYTPEVPGRYIYTLYLMSDCYLGLDQQYDIHLHVTPASIAAQADEISDALTDLGVK